MRTSRFRAGPWPGLTPAGAAVLLGCALLLGVTLWLVGRPTRVWPDLAALSIAAFVPLALAARLLQMPGAASATCGAYLLPRALLSVVDPSLDLPPLLLIPTMAFDIVAWFRRADLRALQSAWPTRKRQWSRRRDRAPRQLTPVRGAAAGVVFGLVLASVEPPSAILLGADPSNWAAPETLLAAAVSAAACACIGAAINAR